MLKYLTFENFSASTYRPGRTSLGQMIPEEGLKPDSYSHSSSTIHENASDESGAEIKKSSYSAIKISDKKKISGDNNFRKHLTVDNDSPPSNASQTNESIDMRSLSVPPSAIKRSSAARKRYYLILGIATIIVCGIAFIIWLIYSLLKVL
ncbi:unnamed protein product [Onchocerca flexuosa]|uniref:Uncharacterized protein n=1 Tax=Onchocerca flexuosa TaxID=387005 RepID=A0A183H9C2_9BILA|nr:unnamed protein product [Onchocerca flexuosa]